jgi:hypothetical protein
MFTYSKVVYFFSRNLPSDDAMWTFGNSCGQMEVRMDTWKFV